jgi:predicted HTH domain antitoxin
MKHMVLTLELPDSIAAALSVAGSEDLQRKALEALAIEGFREKKLSQYQVGQLLGLSRIEAEDLLARHADLYDYDPAELQHEADRLRSLPPADNRS